MLAVVLLAGACGGEDGVPASPTTTADAGPSTPLATPVPGDASRTLLDLFSRGLGATYKVTYRTTSLEGEEGDSYAVFSRPPLARVDTIPVDGSEPYSLIIRGEAAATVSCSGGPDEWECLDIEPLGDPLLFTAGPFVYLDDDFLAPFEVSEIEGRILAGQPARCFWLLPRQGDSGDEIEYCLNGDGIPLYSTPLFGTVEATEVSPDVTAEDFVPPAEPSS